MRARSVSFYYKPKLDDTHTRQYGEMLEKADAAKGGSREEARMDFSRLTDEQFGQLVGLMEIAGAEPPDRQTDWVADARVRLFLK